MATLIFFTPSTTPDFLHNWHGACTYRFYTWQNKIILKDITILKEVNYMFDLNSFPQSFSSITCRCEWKNSDLNPKMNIIWWPKLSSNSKSCFFLPKDNKWWWKDWMNSDDIQWKRLPRYWKQGWEIHLMENEVKEKKIFQ